MTDRPLIGLLAALFVEGRHWIRLRWNFDESSYESAWQLSFVLTAITGVVIWLDDSRSAAVMILVTWMPLMLLPLQFVQSYGMRDWVDLGAFSLLAKRSRIRNQRLGLLVDPIHFNFGNVLLIVTLLASTVGVDRQKLFFLPGVALLAGWALLAIGRSRWPSLLFAMLLACVAAYLGQAGLEHLEKLVRRGNADGGEQFDPRFHTTLIGSRGRVSLSPEVMWRLKPLSPMPSSPCLLRTASYSRYMGVNWTNPSVKFEVMDPVVVEKASYHLLPEDFQEADLAGLQAFQLRGGVRERFPLPLPNEAAALRGLEDHKVEISGQGTVRVSPEKPVIDCAVLWGRDINIDEQPTLNGQSMSERDELAIRKIVADLGLREAEGIERKLAILKTWFIRDFRYTLDLTIRQPTFGESRGEAQMSSAIVQFLTDAKAGHCEYFATAATLLLREAGLQTRYTIGYAVFERDSKRGEFVIRGTHGHAWCRVWDPDRKRWIDFDPTPPDWSAVASDDGGWGQVMKDWLKRLREDFYLWRTDPDHETMMLLIISGFGLGLSVLVVRRLWRSRHQVAVSGLAAPYVGKVAYTPLNRLERMAVRLLGPREVGMPLARWMEGLQAHLDADGRLQELLALHQRHRFDPLAPAPDQLERLAELSQWLEKRLRQKEAKAAESAS